MGAVAFWESVLEVGDRLAGRAFWMGIKCRAWKRLVCLGGVGVRERSRFAAVAVLSMYVLDSLMTPPGVVRILITGLLISNLRATRIASNWQPDLDRRFFLHAWPQTLGGKLADRLPQWLWPKVRIPSYIFAKVLLVAVVVVMVTSR
jgi:hypothetical protein